MSHPLASYQFTSQASIGRPSPNRRPVRCVDTGEVYASQWQAANAIGVKQHRISRAILTDKPEGGFRWERVSKTTGGAS